MHSYPDVKLFINGEWRDALSGKTIAVSDPATDEIIGSLAHAEKEDLDLALSAADKGFKVWRDTSAFERSKIMRKAADLLRERIDYIAWLMTREQGKPIAQSKGEINNAADTIDWFAEEARRTYGQVIPLASAASPIWPSSSRLAGRGFHALEFPDQPGGAQAFGCSRNRLFDHREGTGRDTSIAGRAYSRVCRCGHSSWRRQPRLWRSGRDLGISHSASSHP